MPKNTPLPIFLFFMFFAIFNPKAVADIYIVSYSTTVKNSKVIKDSFFLSPVMTSINLNRLNYFGYIELKSERKDSIYAVIKRNKNKILEFFFKSGIVLSNNTKSADFQQKTVTELTVPPLYIYTERDRSFLRIYGFSK
jgi:hypothetical protein